MMFPDADTPPRPAMTLRDLQSAYPMVNIGQALNLLPSHRFVYVTNPKAGCSSSKLMLQRLHLGQPDYEPTVRGIHDLSILPLPRDLGWPSVMAMIGGAAFIATFVRDPVCRAVSAYADKIQGTPEDKGFDAFLDMVEAQGPADADPHWRAQHINIMMGSIRYDMIGRVESFASDWARIIAAADLPSMDVPHSNHTGSQQALNIRPDQIARLRRIYAEDIEAFGY